MKYKAIIADIDGTLMAPSEYPCLPPSKKLIDAVKKINRLGVAFSIASGRSLAWVEEIIKAFNLKIPIILDNGARIYDCKNKKYIWESLLPKEISQKVLTMLTKDPNLRIIVADDGKRLESISQITEWRISKILVMGVSPKKAEELYQRLKVTSEIHVTKSVSGTGRISQSVHVTNFDATKQVAVGKLEKLLGVKKEEIIGIGDSYNDFPLLLACGLKVAMANAVPEIKAIADYIAPSYQDDGVVEVIERFIVKKNYKPKTQNLKNIPLHHNHNLSGEQKKQLLVLCNKKGKTLGLATREECHKGEGKPHLAFMAFLVNEKNEVILAKRSTKKSLWSDYWDATIVSHILPGETPQSAAKRRGQEEMGIDADFKMIGAFYYFAKHNTNAENEYCCVLIGKVKGEVYPNPIEIKEVKKIPLIKLPEFIKNNTKDITPWLKLAMEKFDTFDSAQTLLFRAEKKGALSINPEHTPAFRPES